MRSKGKRFGKKLSSFLVVLFVLFSSVSFIPPRARALTGVDLGIWLAQNWKGGFFTGMSLLDMSNKENNIVKTMTVAILGAIPNAISEIGFQRNPDETINCAMVAADLTADGTLTGTTCSAGLENTCAYIQRQLDAGLKTSNDLIIAEKTAEIVDTYDAGTCDFNHVILSVSGSGYRGSGSLLSLANSLDQSMRRDEIPVNMALFFKDYAQRIPVIKNTAFAQTSDTYLGSYLVYEVWRVVRDISLGLMSLLLLILGVMIMTRKKINPQTVVTVQNALPRVAISIILIFFSYAIGAFIVKLMMPLTTIMPSIVYRIVENSDAFDNLKFGATALAGSGLTLVGLGILSAVGLLSWSIGGLGLAAVILILLLALAILLVMLIALIKTLLIYVKLLTYIVISPLYFSIGVIPGKESMITDWFKEMFSGVLSVAAMTFMIFFSVALPVFSMSSAFSSTGAQFINSTVTAFFIPVTMLFVLFSALKMPKKVSSWIKGDPKKH